MWYFIPHMQLVKVTIHCGMCCPVVFVDSFQRFSHKNILWRFVVWDNAHVTCIHRSYAEPTQWDLCDYICLLMATKSPAWEHIRHACLHSLKWATGCKESPFSSRLLVWNASVRCGVPVLVHNFAIQLYTWTSSSCLIVCTICTSATLDLLGPINGHSNILHPFIDISTHRSWEVVFTLRHDTWAAAPCTLFSYDNCSCPSSCCPRVTLWASLLSALAACAIEVHDWVPLT